MYRRKLITANSIYTLTSTLARTTARSTFVQCDHFVISASKCLFTVSSHPLRWSARQPHCCSASSTHHHHLQLLPLSASHRHCSSTSSGREPGWLKQRWVKFMTIVRAFANGTKDLYKDMVKMREIQSKRGSRELVLGRPPLDASTGEMSFPLTREELYFTVKTKQDLKKMLPTVVLFFIPFLGYFVPLVAFMYPHRFLTPHFLTEEQRAELMASSHKKILARTKDLSEVLKQRQDGEHLPFLYDASDMFRSGQEPSDVINTGRKGESSLKNVKKENMGALLDVWAMKSWLPFMGGRQRKKLTGHMKYIYTSDWLIKLEGIGSLSHQALSEVCCERRLDVDLKSNEDMKKKLNVWLTLSTSFEDGCPESILAHLPAAQYLHRTNKH